MSDWNTYLIFVDGSSRKYWRCRADGCDLHINYGRIGTDGQNTNKTYASPEACIKEMEKQADKKRKKGYQDEGSAVAAGSGGAAAEPAPELDEATNETDIDFELDMGDRKINLRLTRDGKSIKTTVLEGYANEGAAQVAFDRLVETMASEGYQKKN